MDNNPETRVEAEYDKSCLHDVLTPHPRPLQLSAQPGHVLV